MTKGLWKWLVAIGALLVILVMSASLAHQHQVQQKQAARAEQVKRAQQQKQKAAQKARAAQKKAHQKQALKVAPTISTDSSLDQYVQQTGFSGTVLIVKDQKVILNKGYGLANQVTKQANTPNTLYPIGSTEKAMIATGILQLQEKGRLKTDDPIAKYFPNFPNGQQIKLADLMHHTSGIVGRNQTNQTKTGDQLLTEIIANGTKGQPGQWHYLDANYIVLTKVLEKVSHVSYRDYLQKQIIAPSHMANTGFMDDAYSNLPNASIGYELNHGQLKAGSLPNFTQLYGVGDLYMTATDMYRFDRALFTHQLLNAKSVEQMFQPGSHSQYGMGFYNDPALIVNRGYLSGWSVSNGFSHGGRIYIVLFSNVKNDNVSLSKMNSTLYTKLIEKL